MSVSRDLPSVECDGITHYGKSETRSTGIPRPSLRDTVESLEDPFQMFLSHPYACVIIDKPDVPSLE